MSTPSPDFSSALIEGYARANCQISDGLLLGISGGADSVALLYGTLQIWPDRKELITVAHVNHSLRGAASDEDAAFVAELTHHVGIAFESLTVEQGTIEDASSGSLEAAARKVRYDFLTATAQRLNLASIVTAHHWDDQAETILHNILRGTGLRGLSGMPSTRQLTRSVALVRPMLEIPRSLVMSFVSESDHQFRKDASNDDTQYMRNRIRGELIPLLTGTYNEKAVQNIISLGRHASDALTAMDSLASKLLSEAIIERQSNVCRFNRAKLRSWPMEIVRHAMSLLWIEQQWPRQKMAFRHWETLARGIIGEHDFRVDLPGNVETIARGNLARMTLRCRQTDETGRP